MFESQAIAAPIPARREAADRSKPRRSRAIVLTRVDRRTALGKRIETLKAIYTSALGAGALTEMQRLKVDEAAQLKALAEKARGDLMRDGVGNLDDIVRVERKASAAERALGIVEKPRETRSLLAALLDGAS